MATFMLPVLASPPSALHESTGTSDEVNLIFLAACQIAGKLQLAGKNKELWAFLGLKMPTSLIRMEASVWISIMEPCLHLFSIHYQAIKRSFCRPTCTLVQNFLSLVADAAACAPSPRHRRCRICAVTTQSPPPYVRRRHAITAAALPPPLTTKTMQNHSQIYKSGGCGQKQIDRSLSVSFYQSQYSRGAPMAPPGHPLHMGPPAWMWC